MGVASFLLRVLILALLAALPAGCGAGLISGIAANENSGSTTARPPELSLGPILPLVPAANTTRTVVVTNAQIPASAPLRVTLEALGQTVDQLAPVVSGQGGSTAISFTLDTAPIVAAAGDPTLADVDARLGVLVDGEPVADPVEVVLVRQPAATLEDTPSPVEPFVSPFGQDVTLRVSGLAVVDESNLQMLVETRDPEGSGGGAVLTRVCTGLTAAPTGQGGEALVSATVPGNAFPDRASLCVRDAVSGQSTSVDVYYRPEVTLALPSQGVTTGGNLVTLVGTALVPYDFTQSPPQLDFEAVELSFAKGGRITKLAREDFRGELSAGDRLVFRMPASPDGRPGQVDIVVRVALGGIVAEVTASQVFLFANPHPFFGPRGAVLDRQPVAVAPIPLDGAPGSSDTPDFVVLTEQGGVGFLELLLAQENGMFQRFGARRQIGDHEDAAQHNPRDVCTADFDGDAVPDMFLVNAGEATAVHHLVLGQARPAPPLGDVHLIPGAAGMARCFAAFVDGDGLADVVLVPGPEAPAGQQPQVLLARPLGVGQPAFALPVTLPVRDFVYQATAVADLDGDGAVDVAVVDGVTLQLDVVFGVGDGTFGSPFALDFTVPTYTPDPESTAVGLHACGNGPLQSLALVLSGADSGEPEPVVATLHQPSARVFVSPVSADVQRMPPDPVGVSLVANLDATHDPALELVAAVRGDPSPGTFTSIATFRFSGTRFDLIDTGPEIGGELPRAFRAMHYGRAFPESQFPGEGTAVFAVHESEVDGARERRLSTLLIFEDGLNPQLLPPDAGDRRPEPVLGIVAGNWSPIAVAGHGSVRDLALAHPDVVRVLENDGYGGLARLSVAAAVPGLLAPTLKLVPGDEGAVEQLVFFDASSRLGCWWPDTGPPFSAQVYLTGELRLLAADPALHTAAMADTSRVLVADVDGDGNQDVVALLRFDLGSPDEDDGLLVVLRGKTDPTAFEHSFLEPVIATAVHGQATSIALGDFTASTLGSTRLELAMAIPDAVTPSGLDGDHVRFFRFDAGAGPDEGRFVPSARPGGPQVLLAGSRPTQLAASDLDRDGLVDLLVAADGDDTLRLFRNIALPGLTSAEVEVGAFVQALSSPRALSPGTPTALRLGDVNGDGALDAITVVESLTVTNERTTAVAFYLSEEPGVFGQAEFVSPTRVGDRDARLSLDIGDWNRDGVLDLFLGWDTFGPNDRNVRVLFGGSR